MFACPCCEQGRRARTCCVILTSRVNGILIISAKFDNCMSYMKNPCHARSLKHDTKMIFPNRLYTFWFNFANFLFQKDKRNKILSSFLFVHMKNFTCTDFYNQLYHLSYTSLWKIWKLHFASTPRNAKNKIKTHCDRKRRISIVLDKGPRLITKFDKSLTTVARDNGIRNDQPRDTLQQLRS